jgi:lipid-A-disaccharide synthase
MQRVLVVAGEASADRYAARALCVLAARRRIDAFGIGGAGLEAAGMRLHADLRRTSAMGTTELIPRLPHIAAAFARVAREIVRRPPDLALLVDGPDFNLPLARLCRARGVPVLVYVGPQVWAWRAGRLSAMARDVARTALVLPFEPPLYAAAGVPAAFVGHPLLDDPVPDRATARRQLGVPADARVVAVLPGSRPAEVAHHLPALVAATRLQARGTRVLWPVAPSLVDGALPTDVAPVEPVRADAATVLAAADLALVATGTATLEACRAGVPSVFFHRASRATWTIGRALVRVRHLALPNLLLDRCAFPELRQAQVTGPLLAREATLLIEDPERTRRQREDASAVVRSLGEPGAASRVASMAEELLDRGER